MVGCEGERMEPLRGTLHGGGTWCVWPAIMRGQRERGLRCDGGRMQLEYGLLWWGGGNSVSVGAYYFFWRRTRDAGRIAREQ